MGDVIKSLGLMIYKSQQTLKITGAASVKLAASKALKSRKRLRRRPELVITGFWWHVMFV